MGTWELRPSLTAAALSLALTTVPSAAAKAACREPDAAGYVVEFPQGKKVPIKLYQSEKGGRVGEVLKDRIAGRVELCSEKPGIASEVRLPQGVDLDIEEGKAATADRRYWVRSSQIRFRPEGALAVKDFACERNQGANQVAGGPAGGEGCKTEGGQP